MQLGLSSDAAPDATVADLFDVCARRGLAVLEMRLGSTALDLAALRSARSEQVRVAGVLVEQAGSAHELARLSRDVGAPIVVGGTLDCAQRAEQTARITAAGGDALLVVRGPATAWLDVSSAAGVRIAWQIDDACTDLSGDVDHVLRAHPLSYIRLVGGGPEAAQQDGRGIGALMQRLALARYAGPLILTPSSQRFRLAWAAWLGRRGGWGCGTKAGPAPVQLTHAHCSTEAQ